jgi:D-serine deaminase-like pyridoxal phosphate-dependent protein
VSVDLGLPVAADLPGATVTSLSAEHCRLRLEGAVDATLRLGDTFGLTPYDIGTCANLYDYIHVVRDGRLETVWRVAARGQYR